MCGPRPEEQAIRLFDSEVGLRASSAGKEQAWEEHTVRMGHRKQAFLVWEGHWVTGRGRSRLSGIMDALDRRTFLIGLAAAAGTVVFPVAGQRAAAAGNVAKLGVFAEPDGLITDRYLQALEHFNAEIGRPVDLYRTYRGWGGPILTELVKKILAKPDPPNLYLSFHAFRGTKGTVDCLGWRDIASGLHDAQIDTWAQELATLGPTYVAFHHEMENEEGTPQRLGTWTAPPAGRRTSSRRRTGIFDGAASRCTA